MRINKFDRMYILHVTSITSFYNLIHENVHLLKKKTIFVFYYQGAFNLDETSSFLDKVV